MGKFINKGNEAFRTTINSEYVDKSGMISVINDSLNTERRYICVTRPRRFGKSITAEMLRAYYDESCDSLTLFRDLEIAGKDSFLKHLNKYPVIYLDITSFTSKYAHDHTIVSHINDDVKAEMLYTYPEVTPAPNDDLMDILIKIKSLTGKKFIMIIDEWDAICREFESKTQAMDAYMNFMRRMFKGSDSKDVFAGVYITGILPIKKYTTESALNNFTEYSIISPGTMAGYFGFTENEVKSLCMEKGADYDLMKNWYDGYRIGDEKSIFSPNSVMQSLQKKEYSNYWSATGAFNSITKYIQMDFDGLKDDVIKMLAGGRCSVNTTKFQNDPNIIGCKDDVFTILIHLGYLSYDNEENECFIPNKEVRDVLVNVVERSSWERLSDMLKSSKNLLEATLRCNEEAVAKGIDLAHDDNTSILSYNDENSLSCVLTMAYIYAQNSYILHRELPTGKGFADLVFIPRRGVDKPALVIELKFYKDADTAIEQIRRKEYPNKVKEYCGNILLVGISYDKNTKSHRCRIEKA